MGLDDCRQATGRDSGECPETITYVEDVKDGVCSFYTTLHTELLILLVMSKVSRMSNTMNN